MKAKQIRYIDLNRSKYHLTGVSKYFNDWVAKIKYQGKVHKIGIYSTPEAAHQAYLKTCKALGIKVKTKP